jgi:hypothetical protein
MLKINQLFELFSKTKSNGLPPETEVVNELMKYVNPTHGIDGDGETYMFKVNLHELSQSDISDDAIYKMVDEGWELSKDKKYLVKTY